MSVKKSSDHELKNDENDELNLNNLTVPIYIAHLKPGNTLCANDDTFIVQNGSTTIEIRNPPKFAPRKIPWRDGLIRDIIWCSELHVFVFLTQKNLFTFNPQSLNPPPSATNKPDPQLRVTSYQKIKPLDNKHSFWRCTCVDTTIFVSYSGFGSIIDEYKFNSDSFDLVKRWTPPETCAPHEGIWSIRSHPDTDQIGMSILDSKKNQWRFEIRNRATLAIVWQTILPLIHGDCEVCPLANAEWLIVNSSGIRLIQIVNRKLKSAVEYERELRNTIIIGENYLAVRTKNTLEIHSIKKKIN